MAISLLALAQCAPRYSGKGEIMGDVSLVVEKMKNYRESLTSCRRVFSFKARRGIAHMRGEGLFLYEAPGHYRLDVWDNMGNLMIHYVENGVDRELFVTGSEDIFALSSNEEESGEGGGFTIDELKALGLGAFVPPEQPLRTKWERGELVVSYPGEAQAVQKHISIVPESGMPSRYEVTVGEREARRASLSGVRSVNGIPRSTKIEMVDHEHSLDVVLEIAQESLNAAIPESLFFPSGSPGERP
jgi:outer membrane lipoprotein-sorting protein